VVLFVLSIGVHIGVAFFAIWASHHLKNIPKEEETLDLGVDVTLGEEVQELIAAQTPPEPETPPPEPPPTPPEPPPEPDPEPPPEPMEKPEFIEPKPEPKPKPAPKVVAKPAPAPPGAKTGPTPRPGVVGGNVPGGKLTGTPGGQKVSTQGWKTPRGPYPPAALQRRIQGTVMVRISTNAAGKIVSATVSGGDPELQSAARRMALSIWQGPPNATRTVPVKYEIR
jgi:protein TonB